MVGSKRSSYSWIRQYWASSLWQCNSRSSCLKTKMFWLTMGCFGYVRFAGPAINNLLRRIGCLAVECCVSGSQIIRRKLAPKYACPCDFFIIVPVTIYGTYLCYIHSSTLYPSTIYQTVVGNWSFFYWWKIKRRSCNEWINGFSVHYKVK